MRAVVSVSLPEEMASELARVAKVAGKAKSELIKDALRAYLWEERFRKLRRTVVPKAKSKGFITDEDVFRAIS